MTNKIIDLKRNLQNLADSEGLSIDEVAQLLFDRGVSHLQKKNNASFFDRGVSHPQVHIHLSQNNRLTKRTIITEEYERA